MSKDIESAGADPVTLINVFEVSAEEIDTFIAQWRERAKIMSTAPGFRGSRLHRALSAQARFQIINVARWDSRQAWEAAAANPEFQARLRTLTDDTDAQISANPALYSVVVDYRDPGPA